MATSGNVTAIDFILSLDDMKVPLKSLKGEDRTCCICYDDLSTGKKHDPIKLKCEHIIGRRCLLKGLSFYHNDGAKNACPLCRRVLFETYTDKEINMVSLPLLIEATARAQEKKKTWKWNPYHVISLTALLIMLILSPQRSSQSSTFMRELRQNRIDRSDRRVHMYRTFALERCQEDSDHCEKWIDGSLRLWIQSLEIGKASGDAESGNKA